MTEKYMCVRDVQRARDEIAREDGRKLSEVHVTREEWDSLLEDIYADPRFPDEKRGGEYDELEIYGVRIKLGPLE